MAETTVMNDREPDRNTIEGWQAMIQAEHALCKATPTVISDVLRDTADEIGGTHPLQAFRLLNLAYVIGAVRRFAP